MDWINAQYSLPRMGQLVLITYVSKDGLRTTAGKLEKAYEDMVWVDAAGKRRDVTGWKPLPSPYYRATATHSLTVPEEKYLDIASGELTFWLVIDDIGIQVGDEVIFTARSTWLRVEVTQLLKYNFGIVAFGFKVKDV